MTHRLRTLLLLIITLALACAPLRAAIDLPALPATDNDSHCAAMMHGMPAADSSKQQQATTSGNQTEDCCQQCDGSCADSSCADCVHSSIAIACSIAITPDVHSTAQTTTLLVSVPPGNFSPPYRPPVSS